MIVLQTIAVAFAMFSAIPVPQFEWNEKNMRYAMCAFPLIGVVIGAAWCVCGALPLPGFAKAAGFALIPVWITGGIHLDGYADTCDALSSYGDREKKLEILKDPHCGAFAVIRLCSYFLAYFALCTCVSFTPSVGVLWVLALVLERALSGLAVASFPMAKNTGLAHTFATAADKTVVRRALAVLAAVLCVGMAALGGCAGGALALPCREPETVRRHHRRPCRVVFAKGRALDAGGAVCLPVGRAAMIFITGPLYSGKRTFAQTLPGKRLSDVQVLAADAADLPALADKLAHEYDILIATEVGGGVVPMDVKQRADREAAGRLACLLAARAECVVQMFCGIPTVLKGELSQC